MITKASITEAKTREITNCVISKNPLLSGRKIESVDLIRKRQGKFICKIILSPNDIAPQCIFVKVVKPGRENLSEIVLYTRNPVCLSAFFPAVYGVVKKYGFYWILLEGLKQFPCSAASFETFKKPIELMVSLHSKFYSYGNEDIRWIPHFKKEWQRRTNKFRLLMQFKKYKHYFQTKRILEKDGVLFKNIIMNSRKIFSPLLDATYSLNHGCFDCSHIYLDERAGFRLIDWANLSFAPVTLDLVYLIEKSIDCGISDTIDILEFRNKCLNYYCNVMKNYGMDTVEVEFKKLYDLTLLFKIITQFLFEEFKKMEKGKPSNYNFYMNQFLVLTKSLKLTQ